jgi:SAM-dependent methyltransferase
MRVRALAFRALHALGKGFDLAARVFAYTAAGTLNLALLRRYAVEMWERFYVHEDQIRSGLSAWEERFYDRFLVAGRPVLLVGTGTGRDLLALLQRGHHVDGVELSPVAAARAREIVASAGFATRIDVDAIEEWMPPGHYDAVVFSWYCYGLIPKAAQRIAVLAKLGKSLTAGGRVLVSYIARLPGHGPRGMRITAGLTRLTRSDWRPEPGDEIVNVGNPSLIYYMHCFLPEEIEAEARAAGLRVAWHEAKSESLLVLEP